MFSAKRILAFLFHAFIGQFRFYANPADEFSSADLKAALVGGLISESVMKKIYDLSKIPLPFQDRVGSDPIGNELHTWTKDKLAAADVTNKVIDGLDNAKQNAAAGTRVGNHAQISTKAVSVTTRARNSSVIGQGDSLSYQVMMRQQELKRDQDAIFLNNQASLADDGAAVAGTLGGLPSWIESNVVIGTLGVAGGYDTGTGLTVAYTDGTALPIAESDIRDMVQAVYEEGGDASVLMSTPAAVRRVSEYMFTSGARVATIQADQQKSHEAAAALGAVNLFITDFGTLELVPNRLQVERAANEADVFILDMSLLSVGVLHGIRTEELAKTGLADKRQMAVDYTLIVKNEEGLAMLGERDTSSAMLSVPA